MSEEEPILRNDAPVAKDYESQVWDYVIYIRVPRHAPLLDLSKAIRRVKDMPAPWGFRDYYIAFDGEPEVCIGLHTDEMSRFRMGLEPITHHTRVDPEVQHRQPTHMLAIHTLDASAQEQKIRDFAKSLIEQIGPGAPREQRWVADVAMLSDRKVFTL